MSLSPVLRLHEAAVDFKDVKIAASGEAKRAPPMPVGYSATADIAVGGFDALSEIVDQQFGTRLSAAAQIYRHAPRPPRMERQPSNFT